MESVDTMVMVREGKGVAIKQHPLDKYDIMVEEEKVKKKKGYTETLRGDVGDRSRCYSRTEGDR